jgi:transcription elongation factor GreA
MEQKPTYITSQGHERLQQELERLLREKRPEIAEHLRAAIEAGDLSENAGYEEAKREQAFVEGRIREIEGILANAQIVDDGDGRGTATVHVGSRVTIVEEGYAPETYRIVGSAEASPLDGLISNESPVGKALLGKAVGDQVEVKTPAGHPPRHLSITDIA